jgi:hypothetical protein
MNIDNIWSVSSTAVEEDSGSLKKQCIEFAKSDLIRRRVKIMNDLIEVVEYPDSD